MKMHRVLRIGFCGLLACAALLSAPIVQAQTYPNKPIRIIVPYPPGGTSDILARSLGQKLGESLGQTIVVENKPGANGNLGADLFPRARPMATPCCWPTSARSRSVLADNVVARRPTFPVTMVRTRRTSVSCIVRPVNNAKS